MLFSPVSSALLLAFASSVLSSPVNLTPPARKIVDVACAEYNAIATPGVTWVNEGYMRKSVGKPEKGTGISFNDYVTLTHNGGYTYTISAGVGALAGSELFAEVVRSEGKGLGQQFKFEFFDDEGTTLKAYWISPNQRCTIKSPFDALRLAGVEVYSRS